MNNDVVLGARPIADQAGTTDALLNLWMLTSRALLSVGARPRPLRTGRRDDGCGSRFFAAPSLVAALTFGGCDSSPATPSSTDTAEPTLDTDRPFDTAAPPCEHTLADYGDPGDYATLDRAVVACTSPPGPAPEPDPCGTGTSLLCIGGEGLYWSLSLYFDASESLVGVLRVTDVTEYCDGTSFAESWGDVSCDD